MASPILCDDQEFGDCDNPKALAEWKTHDLNESTLHYYCQTHTEDWLLRVTGHKVSMEPAKDWIRLSPTESILYEELGKQEFTRMVQNSVTIREQFEHAHTDFEAWPEWKKDVAFKDGEPRSNRLISQHNP